MIIDCFPFFNELDLLEIRLNELYDVVDVFVLSEATLTFTGKYKPLYFDENKDRFKKFEDKIYHVIIDNYDGMNTASTRSMDREQKQRGIDAMIKKCKPTKYDMIILSDCDEIGKAEKVLEASTGDWEVAATMEMPLFYYYMNCRGVGRPSSWRNPRFLRGRDKIHYNSTRKGESNKIYWDSGWHFSFLGGLEEIKHKMDSWTHDELNKPPFNTPEHISEKMRTGEDLFNRKRYQFEFVNDLSYLPKYVLDNMDRFGKYIFETI